MSAGSGKNGHPSALHQRQPDNFYRADKIKIVFRADNRRLPESGIDHRIVGGKGGCMGLGDSGGQMAAVGFMNNQRFVGMNGQIKKSPAALKSFQIHCNDIRLLIPEQILENIDLIDLQFIANGGKLSGNNRVVPEFTQIGTSDTAALNNHGDASAGWRFREKAEGHHHLDIEIHRADTVGTDETHPVTVGNLHDLLFQGLLSFGIFTEPA